MVPWFGPNEAGRPSRHDACDDQEPDIAGAQYRDAICHRVATLQWQGRSGFQARPNAGVRHPLVEVLYEGAAVNIALGFRGCIGA
jgi:hypothetical protein